MNFAARVAQADHVDTLKALRDELADAIDGCEPRELAPLARQFRDVVNQLESLGGVKEASPVDDLASKRATRRAAATGTDGAAGG